MGVTRTDIHDAPAELRAVLCYRVSTEEQKKSGFSIPDQERTLRGYCAENRISIVEEIYEEGESGRNPNRASVRRVMELAVAGAMDLVLTTRRDRLFRNMAGRENHERRLRRLGIALKSLDDTGFRFGDRIKDVLSEEQVEWMREATRKGRRERARSGFVVAGVAPFGFAFNEGKTNFVVDEAAMPTVRRIFGWAAAGVPLNSIKTRLEEEGMRTARGSETWSRLVIKQILENDAYLPHANLAGLVEEGLLEQKVLDALDPSRLYGVWWFGRQTVESWYEDDGRKVRDFSDMPRPEWIAVPVPDAGVPVEQVEAARRSIEGNRTNSNAGRRFWELSGGILLCPCGRRMASHTARRKAGYQFYYVCGLRRSNHGRCEHVKYHRAEEVEGRVRAFVRRLLENPDAFRQQVEAQAAEMRRELSYSGDRAESLRREMAKLENRRDGFLDQEADGLITREKPRERLSGLDADLGRVREELEKLENVEAEERRLWELPVLVESYLRDLPELVEGYAGEVRDYETVSTQRTPENPHGIYRATLDSIRHLSEEEVAGCVAERERERGERYASIYRGLGLRGVLSPDGTLEMTWTGGASALRVGSDTSKNKHATKHFHATDHPLVQSFQPGEDWVWCYVDEIIMEPSA